MKYITEKYIEYSTKNFIDRRGNGYFERFTNKEKNNTIMEDIKKN